MNIELFDFNLPNELIAQHPSEKRDHSRLLVANSKKNTIKDDYFYNIIDYLKKDDILVLNDSKVIPARLYGIKENTNAKIEVLLLKEIAKNVYEALVKPGRRVKLNDTINFSNELKMTCIKVLEEGIRHFQLSYSGILIEKLSKIGKMPLPPYIKEELSDNDRYQTIYAKNLGSAAAPTAGLHFTKDLLTKIENKGIKVVYVTLNVGLGTFKPVSVVDIEKHKMHEESYTITKEAKEALEEAKKNKKRIVCVGTTSLRTLESNYKNGFHEGTFQTDIFIYPGYKFKVCDALITNFHLPKSTLLMLVSAFSNRDFIMNIYNHAIINRYRFFSFGDAMLLL